MKALFICYYEIETQINDIGLCYGLLMYGCYLNVYARLLFMITVIMESII